MLTAEQGKIPDSSIILPFPSLDRKAMIKFLEWEDETKRAFVALASITILFKEADDMIFYKYFKEIEGCFNSSSKRLIELEQSGGRNEEKISQELQKLCQNIDSILDQFKIEEKIRVDQQEFGDTDVTSEGGLV